MGRPRKDVHIATDWPERRKPVQTEDRPRLIGSRARKAAIYCRSAQKPRRGRIMTSREEKQYLYQKQQGRCNYCGYKLAIHYFHVDHKISTDRDGPDRLSNKQLLCGPCNSRKGSLTDGEFRRKYRLPGSRISKSPPSRRIPQEYFEKIAKEIAGKKAARRKRDTDWPLL